jgi:hypothetical protein
LHINDVSILGSASIFDKVAIALLQPLLSEELPLALNTIIIASTITRMLATNEFDTFTTMNTVIIMPKHKLQNHLKHDGSYHKNDKNEDRDESSHNSDYEKDQ